MFDNVDEGDDSICIFINMNTRLSKTEHIKSLCGLTVLSLDLSSFSNDTWVWLQPDFPKSSVAEMHCTATQSCADQ